MLVFEREISTMHILKLLNEMRMKPVTLILTILICELSILSLYDVHSL